MNTPNEFELATRERIAKANAEWVGSNWIQLVESTPETRWSGVIIWLIVVLAGLVLLGANHG